MKDFTKGLKIYNEIKSKYPELDPDNFYTITLTEAVNHVADRLVDECGYSLNKEQVKFMITQSLVYNCVIEEIKGQIDFLLNIE